MNANEAYYRERVESARKRYIVAQQALEKVRGLLEKADEEYRREPRKWHRVVDDLEASLDVAKGRVTAAEIEVQRFEEKLTELLGRVDDAEGEIPQPGPGAALDIDSPWPERMNLEEASLLRDKIDSGAVADRRIEAGLEFSNQLGTTCERGPSGKVPRRQLALRAAIDKIVQGSCGTMTCQEIRLVLACRALLETRLEPTQGDLRLRGIIDAALPDLLRHKEALEQTGRAEGGDGAQSP